MNIVIATVYHGHFWRGYHNEGDEIATIESGTKGGRRVVDSLLLFKPCNGQLSWSSRQTKVLLLTSFEVRSLL